MKKENSGSSQPPPKNGMFLEWDVSAGQILPPIRPGKRLISTHVTGHGITVELYPVARLTLTVTMPPTADRVAVRAVLDETVADLNDVFRSFDLDRLIPDETGTGEQPDGSYRYTLTTIADDKLKLRATLVALLLAKQTGKNSVRVQVVSANETLHDIAV